MSCDRHTTIGSEIIAIDCCGRPAGSACFSRRRCCSLGELELLLADTPPTAKDRPKPGPVGLPRRSDRPDQTCTRSAVLVFLMTEGRSLELSLKTIILSRYRLTHQLLGHATASGYTNHLRVRDRQVEVLILVIDATKLHGPDWLFERETLGRHFSRNLVSNFGPFRSSITKIFRKKKHIYRALRLP
jgi:hypothetical protein